MEEKQENKQEKENSLSLKPFPAPAPELEPEKEKELEQKFKKLSFKQRQKLNIWKQRKTIENARAGDIVMYPDGTKYMKTKQGTLVNIAKQRFGKLSKKNRKKLRKEQRDKSKDIEKTDTN